MTPSVPCRALTCGDLKVSRGPVLCGRYWTATPILNRKALNCHFVEAAIDLIVAFYVPTRAAVTELLTPSNEGLEMVNSLGTSRQTRSPRSASTAKEASGTSSIPMRIMT
jgi:hypothetical protein